MKIRIKLEKINIGSILKEHFETLKNANTHKSTFDDFFTFFIIPIVLTAVLFYLQRDLSDVVINIIITSLSIFVGLLFNLVVLIFSLIKETDSKIKTDVLKETIINISYCIVISLVTIIFCLMTYFNLQLVKDVFSVLIYFFTIHFFITLLMVIKRMFKLFVHELG